MRELGVGEELWPAVTNVALLALWVVLPILLIAYVRHSLTVKRIRPEFSLRNSEATELNRAELEYVTVRRRLKNFHDEDESLIGWRALLAYRADNHSQNAQELEDLEANAQHLRATICRLRRQPLARLKFWVHINSLQYALRHALVVHSVALGVLVVASQFLWQLAWASELMSAESNPLVWYPFDARFFYANALAAYFAGATGLGTYVAKRARFHQEYWPDFQNFKEMAAAKPVQDAEERSGDPIDHSAPHELREGDEETSWFAVLGLRPNATIVEIKEAYKVLIKQNHPDLLYGMSPALRRFAEAETKKINAAYQQAMISVSSLETGAAAGAD